MEIQVVEEMEEEEKENHHVEMAFQEDQAYRMALEGYHRAYRVNHRALDDHDHDRGSRRYHLDHLHADHHHDDRGNQVDRDS